MKQSLQNLIDRHEILRTTFKTVNGRPVQVVAPEGKISFLEVDLKEFPLEEREERAIRRMQEEEQQPFDLENGPLMRVLLFYLEDGKSLFYITMHHIISDAWSMVVFWRELSEYYEALVEKREPRQADLPIQYSDYAFWQRNRWSSAELDRHLDYWRTQLKGSVPLEIPTDYPRPLMQTYNGATVLREIPSSLFTKLSQMAASRGMTLFSLFLTAFQVLLYRYSGQNDISVGVPIANRRWLELEGLIGTFVNTLVMRSDLSGDPQFASLMNRIPGNGFSSL